VDDTMEDIMRLPERSDALKLRQWHGHRSLHLKIDKRELSGRLASRAVRSRSSKSTIKWRTCESGGKTRRAAKMNPSKIAPGHEELSTPTKRKRRKHGAIEQGYAQLQWRRLRSVMYQNENLSVRVSDEFMEAAARRSRVGGRAG